MVLKKPAERQRRASIGAKRNPETEAAILDAAEAIIAEKGIAGLRMDGVARAAKAGKATLYRWWPTRGALLLAVYERHKQRTTYPDTGGLESDIAYVLEAVVAHWRRPEGQLFRHIVAEAQSDPEVAEALDVFRKERALGFQELFERAAKRGDLAKDANAAVMADVIMGFLWVRLLTNRLEPDILTAARMLTAPWKRQTDT